jgi:uncharacterized protein (TIGR00725 family)
MTIYIAVIGPSRASPEIAEAAFQVGALIARGGAILVCGGGGGAMEAACRGARSAGGTTVGILPGPTREDANPFVDIAIPTGMGEARNALVVRAADAVIAVGGGVGTLSEIGLALKMGRPVIGLRTWEVSPPAENAVEIAIERVESAEAAARVALAGPTKHFC